LWELPEVSLFGIDIFETWTALAKGYKITQAYLGVKDHDPKDPSSMLGSMFRQVMNTMFTCIEVYETEWRDIHGVSDVEVVGKIENQKVPDPIQVSLSATIDAFRSNYSKYLPIYSSFLEKELLDEIDQVRRLESSNVNFASDTWAKIVYSFVAEFHKEPSWGRDELSKALRVLWIGRVAAFLKETWARDRDESENRVLEEAKVFEEYKPYLMDKYQK
jgi:hypothetical protein